jgi:hypothetical protein
MNYMVNILQSVVGRSGPLIVEYNGTMFIEKCFTITDKHVECMYEKIKHVKYSRIEQTTDTSFVLITCH